MLPFMANKDVCIYSRSPLVIVACT